MCGGCRSTYSVCLWEDKNSQRRPGENVQHDREWPRNKERSTHWPLHKVVVAIVMSDSLAQEPPWPNGQGVGLLIRRLRVRVPQGVHIWTPGLYGWHTCSCRWSPSISRSLCTIVDIWFSLCRNQHQKRTTLCVELIRNTKYAVMMKRRNFRAMASMRCSRS